MDIKELDNRYLDIWSIPNKLLDQSYGSHPRQKFDVYWPTESINNNFPCIIFIHGGGMIKGDKRRYQLKNVLKGLNKGYMIISINYRLAPENIFPAQFEDINAAVRFIYNNSEEYKIDKKKFIIWGESAGSLLAMTNALSDSNKYTNYSINKFPNNFNIHTIVNQYGPTDLFKEYNENSVKQKIRRIQFGIKENLQGVLKEVSPINLVSKKSPNMIVLHGTNDEIVDVEQAFLIQKTYYQMGIKDKIRLNIVKDAGHNSDHFNNETDIVFSQLNNFIESTDKIL